MDAPVRADAFLEPHHALVRRLRRRTVETSQGGVTNTAFLPKLYRVADIASLDEMSRGDLNT
jgi:hypothetical protein